MNSLSWLLYLTNLFSNVGFILLFFFVIAIVFFIIIFLILLIEENMRLDAKENLTNARKYLAGMFLISLFWVFIPSSETMYMIIASESAEIVAMTPEAQAILSDLQEIISIQLESLKGSTETSK